MSAVRWVNSWVSRCLWRVGGCSGRGRSEYRDGCEFIAPVGPSYTGSVSEKVVAGRWCISPWWPVAKQEGWKHGPLSKQSAALPSLASRPAPQDTTASLHHKFHSAAYRQPFVKPPGQAAKASLLPSSAQKHQEAAPPGTPTFQRPENTRRPLLAVLLHSSAQKHQDGISQKPRGPRASLRAQQRRWGPALSPGVGLTVLASWAALRRLFRPQQPAAAPACPPKTASMLPAWIWPPLSHGGFPLAGVPHGSPGSRRLHQLFNSCSTKNSNQNRHMVYGLYSHEHVYTVSHTKTSTSEMVTAT